MTALQPLVRLSRDLADAAKLLTTDEARYLVDAYYSIQEYRKASGNQVHALGDSQEPHEVLDWLFSQTETLESQIQRALDKWGSAQEAGRWARSICGIGPVIAAGLLAHIDIRKAPTVGHIWRFAGLDPTSKWLPKTKRPWNADLKVLCWKIGESFVKVSGNDKDIYGKVYLSRKADEAARNEAGAFQDQAALILASPKAPGKTTDAYAAYVTGKLPPAHIHARAKRYAVKLFLAHYHHVAYKSEFGVAPPMPYAIAQLGHAHYIPPPNQMI